MFPTIPKLSWEVNVWAYLETLGQAFLWYPGDHNNTILAVPPRVVATSNEMWSSPDYMCRVNGSMYNWILECARPYALTPIFHKSDGVLSNAEFDAMIASLGRMDKATIPARDYAELEKLAHPGTRPLVCTHIARYFSAPSMLLLPWDDATFEKGFEKDTFPYVTWAHKTPAAVWRGGSSGFYRPSLRMRVVDRLFAHPNADARFLRGGWPVNDAVIPDQHFGQRISKQEQSLYKYILVLDGNGPASNAQWVFASGSVPIFITHPGHEWWFRAELKPMVNYVPVAWDLSDLEAKLQWLLTHDAEAEQIATEAVRLGQTILSSEYQRAYLKTEIDRINAFASLDWP